FIFGTYHLWGLACISAVAALGVICYWLWTATAIIPEKSEKDIGLGLRMPLYVSGPASVGWWAMLITMLADFTAFISLVFGYFFYWTIHRDFPPDPLQGPGVLWPCVAGIFLLGAWALTLAARHWNRSKAGWFYLSLPIACALALAGSASLLAGPWVTGLDPTSDVYPAIVWTLVLWTVFHAAVGSIMHVYCLARRLAGRMTKCYDIDIQNVGLYWHFVAITVVITVAVIAGFPYVK
ncbi:MAG TPA: hypothetical protein VIT23_04340, partial [Terrimicrobiaceae bacterium]